MVRALLWWLCTPTWSLQARACSCSIWPATLQCTACGCCCLRPCQGGGCCPCRPLVRVYAWQPQPMRSVSTAACLSMSDRQWVVSQLGVATPLAAEFLGGPCNMQQHCNIARKQSKEKQSHPAPSLFVHVIIGLARVVLLTWITNALW
jgi:hypothetical protein